ncbi:hypothetical protein [Flavobacterium capsici]|uniref:Uncharacterized protein n=1 Tax=Flavobacterium capsici TaxID=3075618 RepID=A0AA96F025_9FLAO|nr:MULTISPECIES: hypothetical protein [unclassified Flavobacterium]WNM18866.1 hypothetical protein RN608_12740 [Flavobacterium sp. PMR2A8]WNM22916.1 hypothetical protein RN605_06040 [Flavobacterium sp. PMTSA4]
MENEIILKNVESAINILLRDDNWLLKKDLSERSISHKLAEYLQPLFKDYNVDCEYNGDIDRENHQERELGRKRISTLRQNLQHYNLLTKENENEAEKELIERLVYPDIIIHRRGSNAHNLCIIEVKKSTSQVPFHYDQIKLKAYTTKNYRNLNYQIGYFVKFVTGTEDYDYLIREFQNGEGPELEDK